MTYTQYVTFTFTASSQSNMAKHVENTKTYWRSSSFYRGTKALIHCSLDSGRSSCDGKETAVAYCAMTMPVSTAWQSVHTSLL